MAYQRSPISLLLAAGLLTLSAGCAPEGADGAKDGNQADIVPIPTVAAPSRAGNAVEAKPMTPAVNLAPDALTLVLESGSSRHINFGLPAEQAIQMATAALGSPMERATQSECGAGPLEYATFRDGLTLFFQDGKFAGWDLDGRENGSYSTGNGIALGISRADLAAITELEVVDTSIGREIRAGGLSGLLGDPSEGERVTNLWAGVTCIVR